MDTKGNREKNSLKKASLLLLHDLLGIKGAFLENQVQDRDLLLDRLREKVLSCKSCPLHKTKTRYVFGEGNPYSSLMLVGEAPGREEDISGKPFVGRAGQLLTKALMEEGIERDGETYIANVLKCRPPKNRDPLPFEIEACSPYLDLQIKIVSPTVIVAMGRFAARFLLSTDSSIRALRGIVHASRYGVPVVVTYHPAALLRNPKLYSSFRSDIRSAKEILRGG